jgi:acyl-CoA thioesterase
MGAFADDTAVRSTGDGGFECRIAPRWWVVAGPNGGYIGAIFTRALQAVSDADRPLRSLTLQYLRAPTEGDARVEVEVERQGGSVTFLSARLLQDGRPCVLALAVAARDREGVEIDQVEMPAVEPPESIETLPGRDQAPPFARNFDFRPALGPIPFTGGEEALAGGWLRFRDDEPIDAPALVTLCDSWFPAIFATTTEPLAVPTLDLTVHLREAEPQPPDWVLGRFRTRLARSGFLEEDAELFSRDGRLLAQSRQLAIAG